MYKFKIKKWSENYVEIRKSNNFCIFLCAQVIENPCLASGCSDMCLMAPVSRPLRYTCACSGTKTLAANRHFCTASNNVEFIMAGIGKILIQIEPKHLGKQNINEINLPDVQEIGALAYDSLTGMLNTVS